ncbi:MAG: CRISPR system precrRNA processing endoribonuclease RAMP protein Cas6 [Deltaproteobacteria bacterium]|nr:CRISPR system precrRNA processing endoribonuclease RAMP protein Cas6 [Deltaproteobacteria bacterium]
MVELQWILGPLQEIKTGSFEFILKARDPLVLPAYKGSTLRGGFGYAFKRVVCALKNQDCPNCLLKEKCIYSYVFETPPPADTRIMRKYKAAPHPFIIEPPLERKRIYKTGEEFQFGLILIGRAIDYLPYFIYTFEELGRMGIGKGKSGYDLLSVHSNGHRIYDSQSKTLKPFPNHSSKDLEPPTLNLEPQTLHLSFITPTRIQYNAHLTLDLEFHILIRNLLRRFSLLYYFHCGGDPSNWDFKGLIRQAQEVKVKERKLRWYDWERYSGRQETRMKMGGFMGGITFEGEIGPFMPLIRAGEVLHVGKGTGFGLGKYRIGEDVSDL